MFPSFVAERVSPSLDFQEVPFRPVFLAIALVHQRLVVLTGFIV
jgi:hypothetical protein